MKKKENESIYAFNQRFNNLLSKMPNDVKPSLLATTLHYLGAFDGTFGFMLKEKDPTSLKQAQDMAKKMERDASSVGKSDLLGNDHSRSTPKSESKGKEANLTETKYERVK
jgi:hypothetical protein